MSWLGDIHNHVVAWLYDLKYCLSADAGWTAEGRHSVDNIKWSVCAGGRIIRFWRCVLLLKATMRDAWLGLIAASFVVLDTRSPYWRAITVESIGRVPKRSRKIWPRTHFGVVSNWPLTNTAKRAGLIRGTPPYITREPSKGLHGGFSPHNIGTPGQQGGVPPGVAGGGPLHKKYRGPFKKKQRGGFLNRQTLPGVFFMIYHTWWSPLDPYPAPQEGGDSYKPPRRRLLSPAG